MDDARVSELFLEFRRVLMRRPAHALAPFVEFEGERLDFSSMTFMQLADAQKLALTNAVNEFAFYTSELAAWAEVLATLDEHERFETMLEFVHPLVQFCMGSPYTIKVRFCRSIAQLSHQANRFLLDGWRDDEPLADPNFKTARRLAKGWKSWPDLGHALSNLNSEEFKSTVYDFRNESQHGFPRQIEIGVTPFVHRERTDGGVSYAFGAYPPLPIADALEALGQQCEASLAVHSSYIALLREQRNAVVDRCRVDG